MCLRGLGFLPIALVLVSCSTIVVSYIVAIYRGDVLPFFPYISLLCVLPVLRYLLPVLPYLLPVSVGVVSFTHYQLSYMYSDTGAKSPESCIFGQFVNIGAALALVTMYVRYKLVISLVNGESRSIRRLNRTSMVMAVFISLGLSMVANFQETNIEAVHITGAGLVFGLGVLYELLQTIMSYRMTPGFNGVYICRVRLSIWLVSLIAIIITFVAAVVSRAKWNRVPHEHDKFHWRPEDDGYTAHIVSTMGEWVMCVSFLMFFLTYVRDFQKAHLEVTTHLTVQHLDEVPVHTNEASERTRLLI